MPWWLFKDAGAVILGIAGLYLLCFGTFRKEEGDDSQLPRVWTTYIALAIGSIGAIIWLAHRIFNR